MELLYEDKEYYNGLFDKICDMPVGEVPLTHKDDEQKDKFENHVKHWISCETFHPLGFYIEFSNEYDKLLKKRLYEQSPNEKEM